jgi:HSP20 family molecular chaperone IbpA
MSRRNPATDWMWAEALDLVERAERMQRQFFTLARGSAAWEPPADVFEGGDELAIVVALPGVGEEDVEVRAEPGAILVRAHRPQPLAGACSGVRQLEIPYGYFERRVALPPGRYEPLSRDLTHGCLILRFARIG